MPTDQNRQIYVTELPKDQLSESNFELREGTIPQAGENEVLVRHRILSIDAANRAWMQGATYTAPVEQGDVMHGYILGQIEESNSERFQKGDYVECQGGWQDYSVQPAKAVGKIDLIEPITNMLSVYGVTGLTAYFGLLEVGQPKQGETVVVSAAAGAVGNVVGQIAKIKGCRVVGIAGSDKKCSMLKDELGFDECVNYKDGPVFPALKKACPDGIDVYFDNTGGEILEAVLFQMNLRGRISCCGAISQYDTGTPGPGPRGLPGLLVVKRIKMEGFIVMDYYQNRAQATQEMATWVAEGKLKIKEDVIEGLENAPQALIGLLAGANVGKRMIKISQAQ